VTARDVGMLVLLGHPVRQSVSPIFQNAALRAAGLPLRYEALDVEPGALGDRLRALAARRAAGNVTIPHKAAVAAMCATLTPVAQRAGAVNTFWVEQGALAGDNTDVGGFDHLARRVLGSIPLGARVAVLGAGGAAAAVLTAVERWPGAHVTLCNRTAARADALAARFPVVDRIAARAQDAVSDCTVVVNATPAGMTDDGVPVDAAVLPDAVGVIDLVHRTGETRWVRDAKARGLRAGDGLAMLIEQGALAFEQWFGIEAPRDVMWGAACDPR
jgi:shikimate dehydrogenase